MEPINGIPPVIKTLAERCHTLGARTVLVGGGVRDHVLSRPVKDWDVEVFGLPEEDLFRVLKKLGRVNAVGRSFGVFKLTWKGKEIDVSLPRRDSKFGPGHRGIQVEGDPHMPMEEAARRRDLTINAMMVDVRTGEVFDPYGGMSDLAEGVLRAVDETTFLEDPLRALRVVQFAARLDFATDPALDALCCQAPLDELPAERIQGEWGKLLLKGRRPSVGLAVARRTNILQRVFPEAAAWDDPAVDVAVDRLAAHRADLEPEGRRWAVMLSAWPHRGDAAVVEATLDRLWLHKWKGYPLRDVVTKAVAHWREAPETDAAYRNLSTRTELCATLWTRLGVTGADADRERIQTASFMGISEQPPRPMLQGRHLKELGVKPGPAMGQVLRQVYQQQLDGLVTDLASAQAAARVWLDDNQQGAR